ncbi:heavy-metal-associated domain-containing protein [Emticicia sp. TH156]|uniref:heavy-metal-associated domain-containing protein n=1 Tax=Emticicia sp. TH156 TaxID=2067454 RepID=UPI000C75C1A2|nr:heavy-metal-associated domain-containing protein [Emticicia sp. TH156]PLK42163.1 hypothetical protein C0V77_22360 [Emticicia sp. TH156]
MENQAFKTNINCSGCVARVTNKLNETVGKDNWQVNTENPDKILTITHSDVPTEDVIEAVKSAGFKIEAIN